MALIESFSVIVSGMPVTPGAVIYEGQCVTIASTGRIEAVDNAADAVVGIAGDSTAVNTWLDGDDIGDDLTDVQKATPWSDRITVGSVPVDATGAIDTSVDNRKFTQNRVSDFTNETQASQQISVYTNGGVFYTDMWDRDRQDNINPGDLLYSNAAGKLTDVNGTGTVVGLALTAPTKYPSGIPGTDTLDGSMSLGYYVKFKLLV